MWFLHTGNDVNLPFECMHRSARSIVPPTLFSRGECVPTLFCRSSYIRGKCGPIHSFTNTPNCLISLLHPQTIHGDLCKSQNVYHKSSWSLRTSVFKFLWERNTTCFHQTLDEVWCYLFQGVAYLGRVIPLRWVTGICHCIQTTVSAVCLAFHMTDVHVQ